MDANGYRTRADASCIGYGNGSSFNITQSANFPDFGGSPTHTQTITYNGSIDPASNLPCGLGVIGTNFQRNLPAAKSTHNNDPAAFDQVGKVSLGDLEISDDGKYLFAVNLYDRAIYRLTLNDPYAPTAVTAVSTYSLPAVTVSNGVLRPFAAKFYRGSLYVGAVATAENGGTAADLQGFVFELTNATAAAGFTASPLLQFPLNYNKGINDDGVDETWRAWGNVLVGQTYGWDTNDPQPILAGIDIDEDGSLVIGLRDRFGDQIGHDNYELTGTSNRTGIGAGDMLRAFYNPGTDLYEIEVNAKEGPSSPKPATAGAGNSEGPAGGEFYFQDNLASNSLNTAMGGLVIVPGLGETVTTIMDPISIYTGGISWMNNTTGVNTRDYQLYNGTAGNYGKMNGLGDIELLGSEPPLELGNRLWVDNNINGIQDAGEPGLTNVELELFIDMDNDSIPDGPAIAGTTSDGSGNYYFNSGNITDDADPNTAGVQLAITPGIRYIIRPGSSCWSGGSGIGVLASYSLTYANRTGNGMADWSDSDAGFAGGSGAGTPVLSVVAAPYGQNNHNLDIGFIFGMILPVKLVSFTAAPMPDRSVQLKWTVANQRGMQEYTIEKSSDGRNFAPAGLVKAAGSAQQQYQFTDLPANTEIENVYYRLRMLESTGQLNYSSVRGVKFSAISQVSIQYTGNAHTVSLSFAARLQGKPATVSVLSPEGKLVKRVVIAHPGQHETLQLNELKPGTYIVQVSMAGGGAVQRIMVPD